MDFQAIATACKQAKAAAEKVTDAQMRNAMTNIRRAAGHVGIDPNSLRPARIVGSETIYEREVTKEEALQVIASIEEWAQSWIDRPVH